MHFMHGTTGTQIGLTKAGGFVVMETDLQPGSQVAMHTHENATIVFIVSGQYREAFRGAAATHAPMTVIAKPSGEKHANDIGEQGARCLVVEVPGEKLQEINGDFKTLDAPLVQKRGAASNVAVRIVHELRQPDALTPLAIESAVLQLIVELTRHRPRVDAAGPSWMKGVIDILKDSAPGEVRLSTLAATVGVHPVHLARTFKRVHGCSIGEYARRLQFELAMHMLTRTNESLSDVAVAAGFYDQSHMSRVVKRESGMNPRQIRTAARG